VRVQNGVGPTLSNPAALVVNLVADFDWAKRAGATGGSSGRGVVADAYGNTFVSGYFAGTATIGTNTLTSAGGLDMLLARYDSAGNPVWALRAGGTGTDLGWQVAADPSGNVLVAGYFNGTANFSGTIVNSGGGADPFIAKYSPSGSLLWVRTATGVGDDRGYGVITDAAGNIYLAGYLNGSLNFSGTVVNASGIFLARYDGSGNVIWVRTVPATACCNAARALAYSPSGYVYMSGIMGGTATFGSTSVTTFGGNDFFLAKYDLGGNLVWVRQAGGVASEDSLLGLSVGPDGSVTAVGYFLGSASFSGTNVVAPGAGAALFVANYSSSGQVNWVRTAGGNGDVAGYGVNVDRSGIAWVTGEFSGTANFSGLGVTAAGALGQADIFAARYNSQGNVLSVYQAGGTNYDVGSGVATDAAGTAYITGSYRSVAWFGSASVTNLSGTDDIFLTRVGAGISRPALFATPPGAGNITLSWGVGAADWVLTYTTALGVPPGVINPPRTTNNGIISVTVPTAGPAGFYQLRAP
jgi:hypothetical protein